MSCERVGCLANSPFEKERLFRNKRCQYLNVMARRVAACRDSSRDRLSLVPLGLCVFLGENLSRTQPAGRYHLHLPLCLCCESPVNDQRTGQISPPDTSAGFGATVLSKDAFKEAQPEG